MVVKLLLAPALVFASALIAALYGAIHNQLSYTVSPDYFHAFKFDQFGIPDDLRNRWGAARVGMLASWWMGAIVGGPLILLALRVKGPLRFVRTVLTAAAAVAAVTLIIGLIALAVAFVLVEPDMVPPWVRNLGLSPAKAVRFLRAGIMHDAAYAGALVGAVAGCVVVLRTSRGR